MSFENPISSTPPRLTLITNQSLQFSNQIRVQVPRTTMSCCGGKCGCGGSGCNCGSSCNGCGMYPDFGSSKQTLASRIVIAGVAPVSMQVEDTEMSFGAENDGCSCGSSCNRAAESRPFKFTIRSNGCNFPPARSLRSSPRASRHENPRPVSILCKNSSTSLENPWEPNTMSTAESPGRASKGAETDDPLLKSGSFIDPSESGDPESHVPGTPNNLADSTSNGPDVPADSTPDGVTKSPATDNMGPASGEDSKSRRRVRPAADAPDWLPKGWTVEDRVRTSGATAGTVDKYYCDPVSKHVFRSKNEVLHYVQTGMRLKRKRNMDSPDGEAADADISSGCKQKRGAAPAPPKLDFDNVPTVTWVAKDRAKDSWVPHVDGREVTKSAQQQWSAAFSWITSTYQ
ncbi:hypothetical protein MLD38_040116 [Melastoma candidum]|uniref:Uncharacterized protein n=1 Tax=Melastoma candidum TaxID=119954 RepID=A0ACB9L5F5_9MYRT|nr:hypothetical protein MLD38_040116 [Melastoma candidum]